MTNARWILLSVWLAGLFINFGLLAYTDSQLTFPDAPKVLHDAVDSLYLNFGVLYGGYLTTMLAVAFVNGKPAAQSLNASGWPFAVAFSVSIAWNFFIVSQTARTALFQSLEIENLTELVQVFVKATPFLISPIIAYYFGSEHSK